MAVKAVGGCPGARNTVCGALGVIPVVALAGALVHAGLKLVPLRVLVPLWRAGIAERPSCWA